MSRRNHLFDAMRGIAALLVVIYHFENFKLYIVTNGFLAVDFFFVLSGFVIAQSYEDRLLNGLGFAKFSIMRAVRLYPLVFIGTMFGLVKMLVANLTHQPLSYPIYKIAVSFAFNIFVLPSPSGIADLFPLNGPVWSLFFELVANAAFALVTYRLPRWALFFIVVGGGLGITTVALLQHNANLGWDWHSAIGGGFRVAYGFTFGQLLSRYRSGGRAKSASWLSFLPIVVIVAVLSIPVGRSWDLAWCLTVMLVLSPLLVAIGSVLDLPPAGRRAAGFLGDISYPLYAIHLPIMFVMGGIFKKLHLPLAIYPILIVPTLIFISVIVSRFFDEPLRNRISNFLAIRQSAKAQII